MIKSNYINIAASEGNTSIYRFTQIKWLLDSIMQKKNTLSSPRKWSDPFENALAREICLSRQDGSTSPHPLRNRAYGQCWTIVPETDAFWRMYVSQGDGVRLRSTIRKVYQSLERSQVLHTISCFIGRVQYKTEQEITALFGDEAWVNQYFIGQGTRGHVETLLLKRKEFEPEREVRLLYLDPHNTDYGDAFSYKIKPSSMILEVTFDPRMTNSLFDTYKSILLNAGFTGEINKSTLYNAPKITLCV